MHSSKRLRPARPNTAPEKLSQPLLPTSMHTLLEDDSHESLNLNLDSLPPPFDLYPSSESLHNTTSGTDWATFITSYACGRWDPHRIPRPPRTSLPADSPPESTTVPVPRGALAFERARVLPPSTSHRLRASFSAVSSSVSSPSSSPYPPFTLPGSFQFSSGTTSTFASPAVNTASSSMGRIDATTTAATLRWAGARVRVAPLALPSPEHELTDPMRGASAVPIPGSHPDFSSLPPTAASAPPIHTGASIGGWRDYGAGVQTPGWDVMTPGGTRRSRLSGFWSGTADVDDSSGYTYTPYTSYFGNVTASGSMLPPIDASPLTSEQGQPASVPVSDPPTDRLDGNSNVISSRRLAPATAPMRVGSDAEAAMDDGEDYFGRGERRSGRSSGLRTPPRTREGSASRSQSPQPGDVISLAEKVEPIQTPFSDVPTTPDSNPPRAEDPTRPSMDRAMSGPSMRRTPDSNPKRPPFGQAVTSPAGAVSSAQSFADVESSQGPAITDQLLGQPLSVSEPPDEPVPAVATNDVSDHDDSVQSVSSQPITADHVYSDTAGAFAYSYAQTVPVPTRRGNLTRQASAPLPRSAVETLDELAPSTPRAPSSDPGRDMLAPDPRPSHRGVPTSTTWSLPRKASKEDARALREERAFATREYLAPPYPPDELGRRRALYKFNIMHTGPDLNFDRIAHLAKLVFNTKGVLISVVDGEEEWFKSEWGLNKTYRVVRATSFCGHAILQRGDEPLIVLDTELDWRFAKNPLVTGQPNVRFYAGAPLRTHDGFNIGCLALIDDQPREDFTPRQRHTLKEFAAIAMREMELWRDKIQLRIRDRIQNSMEQFSRECLEIDSDNDATRRIPTVKSDTKVSSDEKGEIRPRDSPSPHPHPRTQPVSISRTNSDPPDLMGSPTSMDTVYDRAAKLVQRTLDVEGVVVVDVSHCEVIESMSAEATVSVLLHHGDPDLPTSTHTLSAEEYARLNEFFERYPEGKISEGLVPPALRVFLPVGHIQYALVVPIYNIDKRPFALLCAWNASEQSTRFLEGHELSYLRAIGVIILSAVLKRRMILADKAKSLFISNISHELRTPLHGILAAAELLGDSQLNHSQLSFLETVQACGTSLVETVNHVLDFTKLSGNSKAGGVENVIVPSNVNLMQLIEEAVDGCWIGHRARTAIMGDGGIGSVYSPPEDSTQAKQLVETVVEIGWRKAGWSLKCEKGGIRRVLMNVFGNSLKFTTNGYVHVVLRELPRTVDEAPNETKIELVVLDSGKGISENFRKNQLFHPFSQENPLQTGTGLGLAIVNSIVQSESVHGKVDVWSEEGVGTEIKVTFTAQILDDETIAPEMEPFKFDDPMRPVAVSLLGFNDEHKGVHLLHTVIQTYLVSWWGFQVNSSAEDLGEVVILNEDVEPVKQATSERNTSRPFIILSALRSNPSVMAIASEHERIGGFCRIIYKPGGPSRLYALLKLCLHTIKIGRSGASSPHQEPDPQVQEPINISHVLRRNSEESRNVRLSDSPIRPTLSARSSTAHPLTSLSWRPLSATSEQEEPPGDESEVDPTVNIGSGGTLLRSSMGTISSDERRFRVLVVEDNSILRNLLAKWLTSRGYDYRDAVDGRNGVKVYEEDGPFDVVLLDMSMPILDGIGATTEIRQVEARRQVNDPEGSPTRILALTGMSSLEDKRRAFEAGVDGYLVKPVAFKTLDEMFSKLGVS
ncbi:histidine kinase [Favolaschia claudopus]|uniref:Histidine kinase n=1 Tax=Favolaschia claudopus TaxID=2862362 RepID=A0AAW0C2V9_9AGAR